MRRKKSVEVLGGGYGAATIMGFCTKEVYTADFIKGVVVVADKRKLGGDKVSGTIISGRYF